MSKSLAMADGRVWQMLPSAILIDWLILPSYLFRSCSVEFDLMSPLSSHCWFSIRVLLQCKLKMRDLDAASRSAFTQFIECSVIKCGSIIMDSLSMSHRDEKPGYTLMKLHICFMRTSFRASQWRTKWARSSGAVPQSGHRGSTWYWLKTARLLCSVYVPVSILAFWMALRVSAGL